jgi:hypothetical protein
MKTRIKQRMKETIRKRKKYPEGNLKGRKSKRIK